MLHKVWNSKGEMPYCFPRSSIKFQVHTGQNITDFDPNWAFPDYRPVAAFKSLRFALFYNGHKGFKNQYSLSVSTCNWKCTKLPMYFNTLLSKRGRHFADDNLEFIFLNGNCSISTHDPGRPIKNNPPLLHILGAWSHSLVASLCATRLQWVKSRFGWYYYEVIFWIYIWVADAVYQIVMNEVC